MCIRLCILKLHSYKKMCTKSRNISSPVVRDSIELLPDPAQLFALTVIMYSVEQLNSSVV